MFQSPGGVPAMSCFSGRCSKTSKWVSFTYGLYTFWSGVLCWFPGGVSLCARLKKQVFLYLQFCTFVQCTPCCFSEPNVLGLASPMQNLRVAVLDVELESLAPQGKVLYHWAPSWLWNAVSRCVCSLDKTVSLSPLSVLVLSLSMETLFI